MIKLFDRFRAGQPSSAVPASWFNAVAGWLNHLRGEGVGCEVTVTKPDHPSEANPPVIRVRVNQAGGAQLSTQLPVADSENGSSGESDKAARGDHSHPHSAKLIEVYDWCIEAEGRIQTAEDNDVSIYDWIDTHVQEENALFEAVNTDLNTLFQNDQTLQNNLTATNQSVANLQDWANNMTTWAQNFDASLDQLFANDQTLYNNQNDLWAGLNSLNEWSNNVEAWSNNVSTDINTLFDAVNRIYYYWRGGYFG